MAEIRFYPPRRPITSTQILKKSVRTTVVPTAPSSTRCGTTPNSNTGSPASQHVPQLPSGSISEPQGGSTLDRSGITHRGDSIGASNVNASVSNPSSAPQQSQRCPHPNALPTPDFYERFPRAVGPLANVIVTSRKEYEALLLTAKRIEVVTSKWYRSVGKGRLCQSDIDKGGFLVYKPQSDSPQYFQLYERAEDVYGTATYLSSKKRETRKCDKNTSPAMPARATD
ncbi:hypothetical protein ABL78_2831 [Leptomonas seymouri]|uniref:Uncharacterized protein n=1 Tax=Leptomonas seymouri TaxID=5684 RepID=A0A0N1ILN8_LEPSE|nr:hypothetical protein ABL78_2831 [Leptomonas seymouri]|eukprot:KPI88055.1 hypothetical protein ABL78_2831 [Leptomonas seymouri]